MSSIFSWAYLLFVLALILLTRGWGNIVRTVTAYMLAHSITLSLAALGYVRIPGPPVEATIALSILFLALACFNIGVELGQLAFVATLLLVIGTLRRVPNWPHALQRLPAYAIGSVSAFWVIERVLAFAA